MQAAEKLIVLTTMPDPAQAEALAVQLVTGGLAACINILPQMTSVYRWQGKCNVDQEHLLIIKTTGERYAALEAAIQQSHPYELPEILALPLAAGLRGYLDWIGENCG